MVNYKHIIIFALTLAITLFLTLNIKDWYSQANQPEISFEKKKISTDTIYSEKQSEIFFNYKNIGNRDLKILKIETTCGCTIPTFSDRLLAEKEVDSFKVRYETENKGHFIKEIMIYSNSKTSPDRVSISGYVPFN